MEERKGMMAFNEMINDPSNLRRFLEAHSPFKEVKEGSKWNNN